MPVIPVYEQRTTPQGSGANPVARGARVLSPIDQNVTSNINAALSAFDRKEKLDADSWFDTASSESQLQLYEYMNEAKNTAEAGAKGFYPAFMNKHEEYFMKLEENAPNNYAREMVRKLKAQSQLQFGKHALEFESLEGIRYRQEQTLNAVDTDTKLFDVMPDSDVDSALQGSLAKWQARIDGEEYPPEVKAKMMQGIKEKLSIAANMRRLREDAGGYLKSVRPQKAGVDSFLNLTMDVEGGYVPLDGASGAPALFGINRATFPKEFDEVNALFQAGDKAGAEQKAREFYKREIWDKNDLGSLDPAAATVVADGLVNHWSGFQKRLLSAARGGATADELLQMRQDEYDRLKNANPQKYAASYEGWMNRLDKVEAAAGAPSNDPTFNSLSSEKQQSFIQLAEQQHKKEIAAQEQMRSEQLARYDSDFAIALERGDISHNDIEKAYERGLLSPKQRKDYTLKLDRKLKEVDEDAAGAMRVQSAIQGGIYLDPRNPADRKAVDKHFMSFMQNDTSEDKLGTAVSLVEKYGIIPDTIKGQLRGQLRSGNPDNVIAASDMVERFRMLNPKLLDDFDKKDLSLANHIKTLTDLGFPPKDALSRAAEDMKMSPEIKKQRIAAFKEETANVANLEKTLIEEKFNEWLTSDPDVPASMQNDFRTIMQEEYVRYGNLDTAKKIAQDTIGRVWGVSSVGKDILGNNGKRWMRMAPENFYKSGEADIDESEWMYEQLKDTVIGLGKSISSMENAEYTIIPSQGKAQDGRPLYYVYSIPENGIPNQIYDNDGKPFLWRPDWKESKERKRLIRRAREARE